jgi:hypothetical protein
MGPITDQLFLYKEFAVPDISFQYFEFTFINSFIQKNMLKYSCDMTIVTSQNEVP